MRLNFLWVTPEFSNLKFQQTTFFENKYTILLNE